MTDSNLFFFTLSPLNTDRRIDKLRVLIVSASKFGGGPAVKEVAAKFARAHGIRITKWQDCINQSPDAMANCRLRGRQYKLAIWHIHEVIPIPS